MMAGSVDAPSWTDAGLRPLAAGELIDRSVVFWRTHFRVLFSFYLPLHLLIYALSKLCVVYLYGLFPGMRAQPELFLEQPMKLVGAAALLILLMGGVWWITWLSLIAGTHYTVGQLLGRPVTLGKSLSRMFQRSAAATLALLVTTTWGAFVCGLALVPGTLLIVLAVNARDFGKGALILAVLGALTLFLGVMGALLWLLLRFFLIPPVLSEETGGVFGSLRRAGQLMSGRISPGFFGWVKVRASVLLTGLTAMLLVVAVVAGTPSMFIQISYGGLFGAGGPTPDAIPQMLLIPAELLQQVVQAVFAPLSMVLTAFFYVDLRVRREGLDLEARLAALRSP